MNPQAKADSPCSHLRGCATEPLLGGSRLSCSQRLGKLQSRQKSCLGDIPVRVQ